MMKTRRSLGFTLTEILVGLLLSSVVMLAVIYVFVQNTEQYYRQEQLVQMQERMRFALEYVKNDLRNAGRLTVVNGRRPHGVQQVQGPMNVQAVELFEDDDPPAILAANNNGLAPDRLRLLVDASGATPLSVARVNGTRVQLKPSLQQGSSQARELLDPLGDARFAAQYVDGYYAYVLHTPSGAFGIAAISSHNYNGGTPSITLTDAIGLDARCSTGECTVNPVQMVEYVVVADPDQADKTNLVRRRIDVRDETVMDPEVIIAEYVVNLQFWGTYDSRPEGSVLPMVTADPTPADTMGNWAAATEQARMNPWLHRLRGMNVLLAVRSPREDKSFVQAPDRADAPAVRVAQDRIWFELDPAADTGLARVATLVTEVETMNLDRGN